MVLLAGVYAVTQWRGSSADIAVPRQMPVLAVRTLGGQTAEISAAPDKMLLINFWAPDCPPCLAETPALVQLQRWFGGKGFSIVGIAVDGSKSSAVRARIRQLGINYPVYLASGQGASQALGGVLLTPTSLLINEKGQIVGRYVGAIALPVIVWNLFWTWV
ncbi:TlpA disulfide reductase family protein [Acidithiobacillus sp. IBUN Pt1247-S3]|uniref:TlpA disulfide reductase family protein n=1 Tax=Acidithiobacillus sp. IBUN Pt1247-S3 TaxID=3166642 RepID=UPI0034E3E209